MTNEIHLRDVRDSDLPIFFKHQRDPEAVRMAAFISRDEAEFNAHWRKIRANESTILRTILYNEEVSGNMVSFVVGDQREVGYWLGREYWGKSIATRALASFLEVVITRPLYAHVAKHNIGSRRVLEKCGFIVMGEDEGMSAVGSETVEEFILRLD